jgi:hypothetical protein
MGALRAATIRIAAVGTAVFLPLDAEAQERTGSPDRKSRDSVTTVAGEHYAAGGFKQTLLGAGWRDVWVMPVRAPSFELGTFAGGLKVLERGGGYQSMTLHLQPSTPRRSADGARYADTRGSGAVATRRWTDRPSSECRLGRSTSWSDGMLESSGSPTLGESGCRGKARVGGTRVSAVACGSKR